jgi:hypothetical protein
MKQFIFFLLISAFLAQGCNLRQREEALTKKEAALNQREQELLLKEKTLLLKEEELVTREQKVDSTRQFDSTGTYSAVLTGTWDVKMTCTETSCPGSAVGDTKNETWQISYEKNNVLARAMVNNELVRVYSGFFTGNTLELVETRENTASQPATRMVVRLRLSTEDMMEGQREIERIGQCKIIYEVVMNKKTVQP